MESSPLALHLARRMCTIVAVLLAWATCALAQQSLPAIPNRVDINPRLVTSGQPSAAVLAQLGAQGFGADIYLAPPTVSDAIRDEAALVGRQGLVFVNIPIDFEHPTEQDYETFAAVLRALSGRKVLVHCQVNMRASSMVFLYRVIALKEDPAVAYQAVTGIWKPEGPWKRLIDDLLRKHSVNFELY
jgi:protein tyrosine phosphatase (PTP) superfamily phosphohydrolase (DUF442 family)